MGGFGSARARPLTWFAHDSRGTVDATCPAAILIGEYALATQGFPVPLNECLFSLGVLTEECGNACTQRLKIRKHFWPTVLLMTKPPKLLAESLAELSHLVVLRLKFVD